MNTIPACPVFKDCGSCKFNTQSYEEQLSVKQNRLVRLLGSYCSVSPIRGMADPLHYRHKVHQVPAGQPGGRILGGYYAAGSHRVVTVPSCRVDDEACQAVIATVCRLAQSPGITARNELRRTGYLRHVVVRKSRASGKMMVILVAVNARFHGRSKFTEQLVAAHPEVASIVLNINDRETSMVFGRQSIPLYGPPYLTETLCGLDFRLSPTAFFQVNPRQTEPLYETAMEFAALSGKETVIDAYCGTGTIGLIAAKRAARVIGAELNPDAVRDAIRNAKQNHITNARFVQADAGRFMTGFAEEGGHADVVFLDPPRSGCSPEFIAALLQLAPSRIVYISCGPDSLSRDLAAFTCGGYRVCAIQPYDLFPFTEHVETVVQLSKGNISSQNVRVEFSLEDMDMSMFQRGATYEQIQDWVQEKYSFHVTHLNIAQVKRKNGIIERDNYNKPKSPDSKQPGCPEEKVKAIEDALKHFHMI